MLSSFGEELGLDRERALRIAGAFGGGMARMGDQCGAVTGACMAIGLKYGKTKAEDEGARDKTYELVGEFVARFKDRNGSIICKELLGHDLSNPQEGEAAKQKGLFDTLCRKLVNDAAEILEKIL